MGARRSIAHRLAHDDRYEAVLAAIHGAGTYAAAGRDASDQQRVDAQGCQRGRQRRTEERAGILLGDQRFTWARLKAFAKRGQLRMRSALKA